MSYRFLQGIRIAILLVGTVCSCAGQNGQTVAGPILQPEDARLGSRGDQQTDRPRLQQRHPRYLVRSSDVLQFTFPFTPEFDQVVTVQPDGYTSVRGIGDLYIEGKTVPEVIQALRTAYGKILHEPVITVELKDFEKPYFIAGGELGRPGKYELRGDMTVTEAVAVAGGFTEKSKHSQVLLFRRVSEGLVEIKKLDVKKMLASRNLGEDVHLRPGDMLYVPKNALSKLKPFLPVPGVGFSANPLI
jgi:protein involved in polysaccharide export with SLBB domain